MEELKIIICPCCSEENSRDAWYETSSDFNAVCPTCSSYVDYEELGTDNEFYITQ